MEQKECVFCSIIKGKIPAKIVYQDDYVTAFLDRFPRSTGMTLVVPKQHYKEFDENMEASTTTFQTAQIIAKMIKQALSPLSIEFSIIPSQEVPHFHIRVYPVYEKEIPLIENQPKQTNEQELNEIAEKIKAMRVETKKEIVEEVKEEPKEPERTREEVEWMKRWLEMT